MIAGQQLTSQQVFSTQYTAIMLIILTFVVGSFSQPKAAVVAASAGTGRIEKAALEEIENPKQVSFGALTIENAFDTETNALKKDQLEGIVLALKSHDIHANFIIQSAPQGSSDQSSAALVARMVSTLRWLESLGIPQHAYELAGLSVDGARTSQLLVEFAQDKSNE